MHENNNMGYQGNQKFRHILRGKALPKTKDESLANRTCNLEKKYLYKNTILIQGE